MAALSSFPLLCAALALAALATPVTPTCEDVEVCVAQLVERSAQVARPGEDPEVRALVRVLAKQGEAAVEPLRVRLRSESASHRAGAARGLAELGSAARAAVPELLEALEQDVPEAAVALGAIGDARAAAPLGASLLRNGRPSDAHALTRLGRAGFEALGQLFVAEGLTERVAQLLLEAFREGGSGAEVAVPSIASALADATRPSYVRAYGAACLGAIGPPSLESAPALRELLKDASPVVQQAALDALAQIGDAWVASSLVERTTAPAWSTRLAAFTGLAHLGPAARGVVPQLLPSLASPDFEQRALAAEALGFIRDRRAIAALAAVLAQNSWSAAEQAAHALTLLAAKEALPALRETARTHWRARVRRAAASAAAEIQRSSGHPSSTHDFREVDRARRVFAAMVERETCPGGPELGWRVLRDGATLHVRAAPGGEDVPAMLPSVLPPLRLGRDDGFDEKMRGLSVEDGWLVARDAGEFGGALWFVGWDGRKLKLADQPVEGFVPIENQVLALGALPHRSRSAGAAWKLTRLDGAWSAEPLAELPGAPLAWQAVPSRAVVVVTAQGAVELGLDGKARELKCGAAERAPLRQ